MEIGPHTSESCSEEFGCVVPDYDVEFSASTKKTRARRGKSKEMTRPESDFGPDRRLGPDEANIEVHHAGRRKQRCPPQAVGRCLGVT